MMTPSVPNQALWHGQTKRLSASSHRRTQPMCVQMADSATYDPSWLIRWPMIAPAVKGTTLPGGTSSHRATDDHSPRTNVSSRDGRAGGLAAAEVDVTALG